MSKSVEIVLPKLGESILSATIVQWLKQVGDEIKLDEAIVEVSTDKVNSEIPSPVSGVLEKICVEEGVEVDVGQLIAVVKTAGEGAVASTEQKEAQSSKEAPSTSNLEGAPSKFYTPVVLKLAKDKGISLEELAGIERTGAGGRLSRKDLQKYLDSRGQVVAADSSDTHSSDEKPVKMGPMRKMIAQNMVKSFYEAPHATLVFDVDVTGAIAQIKQEKEVFLQKNGFKLTITAFLAKAIAHAVIKYPLINSSLKGDTILVKSNVNLGIAVSVKEGVMVPVIQRCQQLSITQIAEKVAELAKLSREEKLMPGQVQEGTITMTNFGMSGAMIGVPIIRFPEVAIIGIGAMGKEPVVDGTGNIVVRDRVKLSLTFDHRVIDGIYGCEFLSEIKAFFASQGSIDLEG